MAFSSSSAALAAADELIEKYKGLIRREMSSGGGLSVMDVFSSVEALVRLANNLLKHDGATRESSTRFAIRRDSVQGSFVSVLQDLEGIDAGGETFVAPSPHRTEIARCFCRAVSMFPQLLHIARQMTGLDTGWSSDQSHSVPGRDSVSGKGNKFVLQPVSSTSSGIQSGYSTEFGHTSQSNYESLPESSRSRDLEESEDHKSFHSWLSSESGVVVGDNKSRNRSTDRQTVVLIEQFAFHLFFMVTRMSYQVLGAQCNDLNHEYMTGGITGLLEVVADCAESAAIRLKLWSSSEVSETTNTLKSRFKQIRSKVQQSLEDVRKSYVPASVGGASYGEIQREADRFSRDVRSRLQLEDSHVIFIFDFHRKVAILNAQWSAGFYKFDVQLNPMETRMFRNEAREFVVMTRSVPNIFAQLYLDAIQAARYHCSRFQLGQYTDSKEFGLQLTFVRFLSDHMRSNLEVPSDGNIQFLKLRVPQDMFYKENMLQLQEAGLLSIEDLYDEHLSSQHRAGTLQEDTDLQKALKLSLEESQSKQAQIVDISGTADDIQTSSSINDGFDENEIALAQAMSLSLSEGKPKSDERGNGSGQLTMESQETQAISHQNNDASGVKTDALERDNSYQSSTTSANGSTNSLITQREGVSTTSKQEVPMSSFDCIPQDPCLHLYCHQFMIKGFIKASFLRIDIVGRDRVGKTSLTRSLTRQSFKQSLHSTEGVEPMNIAVCEMQNWKISKGGEDLAKVCNHFIASNASERLKSVRNMNGDYVSSTVSEEVSSKVVSSRESSGVLSKSVLPAVSSKTQKGVTQEQLQSSTNTSGSIEFQGIQECDFGEVLDRLLPKIKPDSPDEISDEVKQLIGQYYRGELQLKFQRNEILVSIFDYGGHTVYQSCHAPFLEREALKLVVFDASIRLEDFCLKSYFISQKGSELWGMIHMTNWEVVEEWLSHGFVSCQRNDGKKSKRLSNTVLVGTHKDKAEAVGSGSLLNEQNEFIKKKIQGKPYEECILRGEDGRAFVCVDNTLSGKGEEEDLDEGIRVLKNTVEKLAIDQSEALPVRWFQLAMAIRELRSNIPVPIVTVKNLVYLATELNLFQDAEDFKKALTFLNRKGVVLYRPTALYDMQQESLVIDPHWLTQRFSKVLTIHRKDDIDVKFWRDLADLQQKGILTKSFAYFLLGGSEENNLMIIELMESYDLICPYYLPSQKSSGSLASRHILSSSDQNSSSQALKKEKLSLPDAFFVPSLLHPCKPRLVEDSSTPLVGEKVTPLVGEKVTHLWFHLPKCQIPQRLITRLLSHLVREFSYLPQLFYRAGVFNVADGHRLHLVLKDEYLQLSMYIVENKFDIIRSGSYCEKARNVVQSKVLDSVKTDLPGLEILQRGFLDERQNPSVFYVVKRKRSGLYQLRTEDGKSMATPPMLDLWFNKDKKGMKSTVSEKRDLVKVTLNDERQDCVQSANAAADSRSRPSYPSGHSKLQDLLKRDELCSLFTAVAALLDDDEPWPKHLFSKNPSHESAAIERKGNWRGLWQQLFQTNPPEKSIFRGRSPTEELLKKWSEEYGEEAVVESLIDALSAIRRDDVANLLQWNLGRPDEFYEKVHSGETMSVSGHNVAAGYMPSIRVYNTNYYLCDCGHKAGNE